MFGATPSGASFLCVLECPLAKRIEPTRKRVPEILEDLEKGHREAAFSGPEQARRYLLRTFEAQASLPRAVRAVAMDHLADAEAQLESWEACEAAVVEVLALIPDLEAEFPHQAKAMVESLCCFERGIQARSELGDFAGALALAREAVARDLGAHYQAKADSLSWAE